jgi:nucleoside-diphosphate-sugar epimerase
MVHVDDLADLVVLAVERGQRGVVLHGVAEPAVPVKELAVAADLAAGGVGRAEAWPVADAASVLGAPFAAALALNQEVLSPVAKDMGWTPRRMNALTDLRSGSYRDAPTRPAA